MKYKVLVVETMLASFEAELERRYDVLRPGRDDARIAAELGTIRAVATSGGRGLETDWFDRLVNLKLIAVNGVGTDKIDLELARERGIHVAPTLGVLTDDVADFGMALILGVLRRLGEGDRLVRSGGWAAGGKLALGASPRGKVLGIVGFGQIGKALARRGEAFGMRIAYWNRSDTVAEAGWQRYDTVEALAAASDVLALTVAGTPETRNMIDAGILRALGPKGVLINIARGSVVDEDGLIAALRGGEIGGAGLDVFVDEPRARAELAAFDNVLLAPHQASATIETRTAMGDMVLANLDAFFADGKPLSSITG